MDDVTDSALSYERHSGRGRCGHSIRRIVLSYETTPARLTSYCRTRRVCVARCVRRSLRARTTCTAVDVADENATLFVYCNVEEVQQVAADVCAALRPDASALYGSAGRYIRCRPGLSSIE